MDELLCLSFYNDLTEEWECQDYDLLYEGANLVCGVTGRFIPFSYIDLELPPPISLSPQII